MRSVVGPPRSGCRRRRGVVVIQVVVVLAVLLGFAAFTIDVGMLYRARGELQAAADSAALAAASAYSTDSMLKVRFDSGDSGAFSEVLGSLGDRAHFFAGLNETLNASTLVETADIAAGWLDLQSTSGMLQTGVPPDEYNAVRVIVRRENGENANGPVPFFFGSLFGKPVGETSAFAVAVFNDHFSGFDVGSEGSAGALPISVHEDVFKDGLVNGPDVYLYDSQLDSVERSADGVREINLYPYGVVPGNFGLLNIGTPNQGTTGLRDQIENGVSAGDMENEVGTSQLTFFDDDGTPQSYQITGDPGMKSALESALADRIGDVVAFFLHDAVASGGSNSTFEITMVRFGRLMDVSLNGPPPQRGVWIQPVSYNGAGIRIDNQAPPSDGLVGRLVLAR